MNGGEGKDTEEEDVESTVYATTCENCGCSMTSRYGKRFCRPSCKDSYHKKAHTVGELKMKSRGIKYAKLATSKRLQRLLKFLSDCKPHTTKEIFVGANICAVNTAITELRRNGFNILCRFKEAVQDGSRIYEYQLCKHSA